MSVEWVLPDDLTAARIARELVADDLEPRAVPEAAADDLVLIASELAANAIRHGRPPVLLRLDYSTERIRLTVSNHGDSPEPRVLEVGPEAGHGRGLAMVAALATDSGWERHGDRLDVWAEVGLTPAGRAAPTP